MFLQALVLAGKPHEIQIEDRVLLCQLHHLGSHELLPVLACLAVAVAADSQGPLRLAMGVFLLLEQVLILLNPLLEAFFFALVVALDSHVVLVELILCEEVVAEALVEVLDFLLLSFHILILACVDFA